MSIVAVLQMVSKASVKENLTILSKYFRNAQQQGAKLLVLPENFAFMGLSSTDKLKIAETYQHGPIQEQLKELAQKYNLWVIAGTIPLKASAKRVTASSLVYNNNGVCVSRYDKIHLFDVKISKTEAHNESKTIEFGKNVEVVDTPIGKVGLSVCYDVRFPELYRKLVAKGTQIFSIPSAFTATTGKAHWEILLRARAIENLCYVLAPNQGGKHENGRKTYGHSMIVNPWGKIINQIKNGSGLVVGEIDLQYLKSLRKDFPCNDHRRL